ncbi:hypothetical protein [Legionella septentrionalis]|uniref:Uncharacterized protein n=1 Tax=Legionella septentrionalis TaxID=2498109 RepID=A0A3S0VMC7_9GAMM|nr:hypothetical protein [Legionella septentrionalis]RUQ81720.1 hypothetical protein EKM59_09665 [Legionella septentrionalis]
MITGYYIFAGNGDYHNLAGNREPEWTVNWDFKQWKQFVDDLADKNINLLMIYLNGHSLPYKSQAYPELSDSGHPNVKDEFFPKLFSYIRSKNIQLVAVITTTGHAGKFSELNPNVKIVTNYIDENLESALISFPEHLRKGKIKKVMGQAQLGYGVVCHNKPKARRYAVGIISEILKKYGRFFSGVAIHPPESLFGCQCRFCGNALLTLHGKSIEFASQNELRRFFITSYLQFQKEIIFKLLPDSKLYTFTIPWLFEENIVLMCSYIPKHVTIIDWDYNLAPKRLAELAARLNAYLSTDHEVLFMPTAGFSFDTSSNIEEQIQAVHKQIKAARNTDISGIISFLGPKLSCYMEETAGNEI